MSFLGAVLGGIGGFITGGPAGAVIGAVGGASAGSGGASIQQGVTLGTQYATRGTVATTGGGGLSSAALPVSSFPATRGMLGSGFAGTSLPGFSTSPPVVASTPSGAPVVMNQNGQLCTIKGHHLNRSKYFKKRPGIIGPLVFGSEMLVDKGTECVKNRRMNVGNARALRHALRRARGFEKLAMRTIRILHPTKRGRFGGFKTRRRSSR